MTFDEIHQRILARFGPDIILRFITSDTSDKKNPVVFDPPQIVVSPEQIAEVAHFCRDDEALRFDSLMNLASIDRQEHLSIVYYLHSMSHRHKIALRSDVARRAPSLPTVERVWATASWHEREAHDLMGIVFEGHHDLRPILLPDGWEGYPLRKDYRAQEYYKGMKVPY